MDLADFKHNIIVSLICSQPDSYGAKYRTSKVNKLSQIINEEFHSKEDFLEATAHLVSHKNGQFNKNSENISLRLEKTWMAYDWWRLVSSTIAPMYVMQDSEGTPVEPGPISSREPVSPTIAPVLWCRTQKEHL